MSEIKFNKQFIFFTAWVFYSYIYFFLVASSIKYIYTVSTYFTICQYIVIYYLAIFLLIDKYNLKNLCITAILLLMSIRIMNREIMIAFLFSLYGKNINFKKFIRMDMIQRSICVVCILLLYFGKVIPNMTGTFYAGVYKQSWGFQHPNTLGMNIYLLMTEYLCLRYYRLNIFDIGFLMVVWYIFFQICYSRTSAIAFLLVLFFALISKVFPKILQRRVIRLAMTFLMPILVGITFFLTAQYSTRSKFILTLNKILSGRIYLQYVNLNRYGITWFGQNFDESFSHFLDSGYLRALLEYGVLFLALITILYMILIHRCIDRNRSEMLCVILFCLLMGFSESSFLKASVNISFVLFFNKSLTEKNYQKGIRN